MSEEVENKKITRVVDDIYNLYKRSRSNVIMCRVQDIKIEEISPQRGGVILYTIHNGIMYFGMGLDARTHDLTDFGGTICYKFGENAISGSLREFNEETLNIFTKIGQKDVEQCGVLYDKKNIIIFVYINEDPNLISKFFVETYNIEKLRKTKYTYPEVCSITWFNWNTFQYCIKTKGIMFERVRKFLQKSGNFSSIL